MGKDGAIYTIGFTGKSAERFFSLLSENGIDLVVDIRLRPDGQLSGFAKRGDLPFFLRELAGCAYVHVPELAPDDELIESHRQNKKWDDFASRFEQIMDERGVPGSLDRSLFDDRKVCLLCSEARPQDCHRSLVAERLAAAWGVEIVHLS